MTDSRHRHKDSRGQWTSINPAGGIDAAIADHEARIKALEAAAIPVPPDPVPPTTPPDRTVTGTVGDVPINEDGLHWFFAPGCVVKGTILISAKNVTLTGFHTTSEQSHESAVILLPGSSGILQDGLIENIGTPANGVGYGTIRAHDTDATHPNGGAGPGTSGPWTFRRCTFDQKNFGWYGVEVWGVKSLVIEDCTFKGKGVPVAGKGGENGHMSTPRCDGAIYQRNLYDMRDGCWRVIELVESNDWQFIDNTVLGRGSAFGDCCPLALGGTGKMQRGTIQRNRVRDMRLFVNLAGSGHTITDNRLTNVSIPFQGSAANTFPVRNDANSGPAW